MTRLSADVTTYADRMLLLERSMVRIRWFGIALGLFQVWTYTPNPGTVAPESAVLIATAGLLVLLIGNVTTMIVVRRWPTERPLAIVGAAAFAADMAGIWTIVWAYNFEQFGSTWVVLLVLGLEGALRYRLRGAMVPVFLAIPIEVGREIFTHEAFGRPLLISSVTFRVGFMAIIGAVAGVMARNLERERSQAETRAVLLEQLADRETAARRESAAFQEVILAGVSAATLVEALQSMITLIGTELGYERIAVLMLEDDQRLHPVAGHGFAPEMLDRSVALGEGIAGAVAVTRRTEITPDVSKDPRYFPVDEATRSQITVPILSGDVLAGVLDVESSRPDAFDENDASRLERLSAQMGLVIEQARLLAQERATVERLRELDVMKSDFIAIASHELRTPLTSMKGSIKTLRRHDIRLPEEHRDELLNVLDRQSERLHRLVEDLLIASRIDAGRVSLQIEPFDITDACKVTLEELGVSAASRVSVALPQGLPRVHTDGQRVCQIVRNIVENALKFSPDDKVVRVTIHHDGHSVLFEVTDEGPGIPHEDVPRIFDRFHQVGGSLRRTADGFGLGLYIAKRLVEALAGRIEVDSKVGRGTTFRIYIPAEPESDAERTETA